MDSHDVRRVWKDRTGEYSPAYYAYYGPDVTSTAIRRVLDRFVAHDDAVLELGCSAGRHLAHLADHGYEDLTGIDVNDDAFEVMAEHYPELAERGTFHRAAIEDVVRDFEDDRFDAVYSVETLQHLHHDADWVFDELARVTGDLLVTVENEGDRDDAAPTTAAEAATGTGAAPEATADVTYVDDDVPLYHRDWHAIFTDRGFVEVALEADATADTSDQADETDGEKRTSTVSAVRRDTIRAFRKR